LNKFSARKCVTNSPSLIIKITTGSNGHSSFTEKRGNRSYPKITQKEDKIKHGETDTSQTPALAFTPSHGSVSLQ
jgi:hypothetical protein